MMMRKNISAALSAAVILLALAGCGGGGSDVSTESSRPPQLDTRNNSYRIQPGAMAGDAKRSPIYRTESLTRVGVDQGSAPERLPRTALPGYPNIDIRYGSVNDGAGASILKSYLASVDDGIPRQRRLGGYEVRVIGPSTATERNRVLAAVQLINAALPENAKLSIGSPIPSFSLAEAVSADGEFYFGSGRELPNTIHVEFSPDGTFGGRVAATSWGEYILFSRGSFPAYRDERFAVILTAHELIHSLGLDGHVSEGFDSIMEAGSGVYAPIQGRRQPASLLYPIDREALRALYGPLQGSSDPDDLGPWSSVSDHFFVRNEYGAFGVANRNGYAEPSAYGITPSTSLTSNSQLSSDASWNGAIVGFTPSSERVVGDAGITVNLGDMSGRAAFMNLAVIEMDGRMPQWGDGDLLYNIAVQGNTLRETGGDEGRLTGVFAGHSHEAVGGTLERSDLTAAFGAVR